MYPSQDPAIPRVERDVDRIERVSRRLATRSALSQGDGARLLAQEGMDPRRLGQAMEVMVESERPTKVGYISSIAGAAARTDEVECSYGEVDRYVTGVHDAIAAAAVQEARRSTIDAFQASIDAWQEKSWAGQKRSLLAAADPFSFPLGLTSPSPAPSASKTPAPASSPLFPSPVLRGGAAKYAEVVQSLAAVLTQSAGRGDFGGNKDDVAAVAAEFKAACPEIEDPRRTTMGRIWHLVAVQLSHGNISTGSRRYLEQSYVEFMRNIVSSHRSIAGLGGEPTSMGLVHAFLRVKEKDKSPFDFDRAGTNTGTDTTWMRLYTCLRAGFVAEARQLCSKEPISDKNYPPLVRRWLEGDSAAGLVAEARAEARRLLLNIQSASRRGGLGAATDPHQLAVYTLIAKSNTSADALMREFPNFCPSIEDYLWLKLGIVASDGFQDPQDPETLSLDAFQRALAQYPASHFSGRDQLLYIAILLLTGQWDTAVDALARHDSKHRIDALHLCICLWYVSWRLSLSNPGFFQSDRLARKQLEALASMASRSVEGYAKSLVGSRGHQEAALWYYALLAGVRGGTREVKASIVQELMQTMTFQIDSFKSGGSGYNDATNMHTQWLRVLMPDEEERKEVMETAAEGCDAREAVELFLAAGKPARALDLLLYQLSDALVRSRNTPQEVLDYLFAKARTAAALLSSQPADKERGLVLALDQLKTVQAMLDAAREGKWKVVLAAASSGPLASVIPTSRRDVATAVEVFLPSLHRSVADRMEDVLVVLAQSLNALTSINALETSRQDELNVLILFATSIPSSMISRDSLRLLNKYVS